MSNKYGIPEEDLKKIRTRDTKCIYCHKVMIYPCVGKNQRDWATIEHLNHLPPWNNSETVAICCGSCNSSRGKKELLKWFEGTYCKSKNINEQTVSETVRDFLHHSTPKHP